MIVDLTPARQEDKVAAEKLFHEYIQEMSEFMVEDDLSTEQRATYIALLANYWDADDHFPFLIFCNHELAGFSLVRRYPQDQNLFDMGQFFVLSKFKGIGVGRKAFHLTLARFPGHWLTRVLTGNVRAFEFWKKVISEATEDNYSLSTELDKNVAMHFIRFTV